MPNEGLSEAQRFRFTVLQRLESDAGRDRRLLPEEEHALDRIVTKTLERIRGANCFELAEPGLADLATLHGLLSSLAFRYEIRLTPDQHRMVRQYDRWDEEFVRAIGSMSASGVVNPLGLRPSEVLMGVRSGDSVALIRPTPEEIILRPIGREAITAGSDLQLANSRHLARVSVCFSRRFEGGCPRTTSRVVANSSPRQTHERRVLPEGASFALYAGISRGGPGLAARQCARV
jgi:hypothetical protein